MVADVIDLAEHRYEPAIDRLEARLDDLPDWCREAVAHTIMMARAGALLCRQRGERIAELEPFEAAVKAAHNGYDAECRAAMPELHEPATPADALREVREEVDELHVAEVRVLEKWIADLQSGMYVNCVYCGHRYGPSDDPEATRAELLHAHVEVCPKHPMSELKTERDELQACFDSRWKADMRAIKRWQEAHPGHNHVWPDHADLCVWLLDQIEKAEDGCKDKLGGVRELTAHNLLRRVLRGARGTGRIKHVRWSIVSRICAIGSTYATELCRNYELDPEEQV